MNYRKLGLVFRFVPMVFFITLFSSFLTVTFAFALIKLGLINVEHENPMLILVLLLLSSVIIGTLISYITSKNTLHIFSKIVNVLNEIGSGNFDVEIADVYKPAEMSELIDKINKMAKELKNIEIMKSSFINDFSHELRTPIVSIAGFAERLLKKDITEEKKIEYVSIIQNESNRLVNLSSNLLLLAKLEYTDINIELIHFRLDEQIRDVVILLNPKWSIKDINFQINLDNMIYYGNADLLKEVWINLLDNAIKYSNPNSTIKIENLMNQNDITINIVDNGIGIKKEDLEKIFDKFYQSGVLDKVSGSGVGLSIAKKVIELHHGKINVCSTYEKGTIVEVILPLS